MLKEHNAERHAQLERELSGCCYRRLLLTRELETLDKTISQLEAAITENEATQRDLQTQEVIEKAKAEAEVKIMEVKENA